MRGSFNADLFETVLLHIEENNDQQGKVVEILKSYVTHDEQRFNAKYRAQAQVRKYFGVVLSFPNTKAFYQWFVDWLTNNGSF